jgi:hypothetical protein
VRRLTIAFAALLVGIPALRGADQPKEKPTPDKPQTPAEQFKTLVKEQQEAQQAFMKAYREAKNDEERKKLVYPSPEKLAKQVFELAEKNPKDPFAVDALIWVVQNSYGDLANKSVDILAKDYAQDKKVGGLARNLVYSQSASAEKLLKEILEKNPDRDTQAQACLSLAKYLKQKADRARSADTKEAEKYFELTAEKYGDVTYYGKKTLGDAAKASLFEIRNLGIGKTAPEVAGKDIDDKEFKLADYRGKVVLLDFWGNW